MSSVYARLNGQLLDAGLRLTARHPSIPAGSVLRCFARSVQISRRDGCPLGLLAVRAETLTDAALARRTSPLAATATAA